LENGDVSSPAVVEILVEIRGSSSSRWVREPLELENRLQVGDNLRSFVVRVFFCCVILQLFCISQVGDYVDAQDTALKWYEAIVREIKTDTVKVHFFGWGSRWDAELPRRKGSAKV
jgi:hypothetical protein